jgi:hypothetical protein
MKPFRLKTTCLTLCIILGVSLSSFSQYYYYNDKYYDKDLIWEVGASFGGMYSLADVGKKKYNAFLPGRLDYKSTKANGGIYVGVLYQNLIGGRLELTYGSVSGSDSTGSGNRKIRNLSYRSDIREIAVIGEFHPLTLTNWETLPAISPYFLGGIGWFSFNPQAKYNGQFVDLQPLNTAGQGFAEFPERKPYRLSEVCLPFGIGFKYELSHLFTARFEIVERYTFTDYLDDASASYIDPALFYQYNTPEKAAMVEALANRSNIPLIGVVRGGTATKDKYLTINLKLGLTLGRELIR